MKKTILTVVLLSTAAQAENGVLPMAGKPEDVGLSFGDAASPGSLGEYGWAGNAGTLFWVDPKEQLFAIYMVQASAEDTRFLRNQFRSMVQAAIAD